MKNKTDNIHRYIYVDLFYLVITWYSFRKGHEYLVPAEIFKYSMQNKDLEPYAVSNKLMGCIVSLFMLFFLYMLSCKQVSNLCAYCAAKRGKPSICSHPVSTRFHDFCRRQKYRKLILHSDCERSESEITNGNTYHVGNLLPSVTPLGMRTKFAPKY